MIPLISPLLSSTSSRRMSAYEALHCALLCAGAVPAPHGALREQQTQGHSATTAGTQQDQSLPRSQPPRVPSFLLLIRVFQDFFFKDLFYLKNCFSVQKQNDKHIFLFPPQSSVEAHNASHLITSPSQNKPTKSCSIPINTNKRCRGVFVKKQTQFKEWFSLHDNLRFFKLDRTDYWIKAKEGREQSFLAYTCIVLHILWATGKELKCLS